MSDWGGINSRDLDRYLTGGRYHKEVGDVTCASCGEQTTVVAETEYGTTSWGPEECPTCHVTFTGDEAWAEAEPPEPDHHEEEYE